MKKASSNTLTGSESILGSIKTIQDIEDLVIVIDLLSNSLFKKMTGSWNTILDGTRSEISALFKDIEVADRKVFLTNLRESLLKMRVLHLTVATSPTNDTIGDISEWVKTNVDQDVVLEFEVDPALVGGAVINFEGKYKDLSFKSVLAQELEAL